MMQRVATPVGENPNLVEPVAKERGLNIVTIKEKPVLGTQFSPGSATKPRRQTVDERHDEKQLSLWFQRIPQALQSVGGIGHSFDPEHSHARVEGFALQLLGRV